ncbi:MAG: hypothetical protein GTN64_02265 [Candidatus Latescibacteria bacterium]|nr:hypothetical protein [Candidatus Latescibacterota bacterium]NIO77441.1 hypothetical protein [Candidatus Latescibacterota bacterium]
MLKRWRFNKDTERVNELKRLSYRRCFDKNPEHYRSERRSWWEKNKQKARESNKKWAQANRLKKREYCRAYQARKKGAVVEAIDREVVFRRSGGRCQICGNFLDKNGRNGWHLDHIVPLSAGGEHSMRNVQALCPVCNLSKGARVLATRAVAVSPRVPAKVLFMDQ